MPNVTLLCSGETITMECPITSREHNRMKQEWCNFEGWLSMTTAMGV